jgi:hypothetical protein
MSKVDDSRKKTGGRSKGTPNKLTEDARKVFLDTLEGQAPHIAEAFEEVRKENPKAYLDLFAKYAQYFVPKKTENSHDHKGNVTQNIINLGEGTNPNEPTTETK